MTRVRGRAEHTRPEVTPGGTIDVGSPAPLAELRRCLDDPSDHDLQLYYQPQVDPRSGCVVGAEVMPRWHRPGRSPLDPAEVLRGAPGDPAERTAVARLLATRVLDDVVAQLARWGDAVGDLRVSVNVTMQDLICPATGWPGQVRGDEVRRDEVRRDEVRRRIGRPRRPREQSEPAQPVADLVERLTARLAESGVPATRLQLEINDGALPADARAGLAAMSRLRRLGVSLALDHFGTGTASLALMRRLPLAEVKIDRSFVLGAADGGPDAAVVRAVAGLAADLGLRAVAEGVEDERTWRALARAGCVLQGWYCARPMPAERLVNWIALYRTRLRPQLTPGAGEGPGNADK
jgi:EAL domain-containing protein (putative c-di-GMP-specific phosphodiesterase class I)